MSDLQRDGYLRSIAAKNLSWNVYQSIRDCDFELDSIQMKGNVLQRPLLWPPSKETIPIWMSGTLCGGLLTNRHVGQVLPPPSWDFTLLEWNHWRTTVQQWGLANNIQSTSQRNDQPAAVNQLWLWRRYQDDILETLNWIALKHRVSIASVAIRWALQWKQEVITSAVITSRLRDDPKTGKTFDRQIRFREVFRFELDEEDMSQLSALAIPPPLPKRRSDPHSGVERKYLTSKELEAQEEEEEYQRIQKGEENQDFEPIDFSNRSLWL